MNNEELWNAPEEPGDQPEQSMPLPEEFSPSTYCYLLGLETKDAFYGLANAFYVDDDNGRKWTLEDLKRYREEQARIRSSLPATREGMTPQEVENLYRNWKTELDYWRRMQNLVDEKTAKKPRESALKKGEFTETRELPQIFEGVVLQVFLQVQQNYLMAENLYDQLEWERQRAARQSAV